jgi:ABC-type xylose transport system substrate-binding protein
MERREEEFIVSLLDKDPELRRYYEEHQDLEKQLETFQHKPHLSSYEEVEKKTAAEIETRGQRQNHGDHRKLSSRRAKSPA